MHIPDALVVAFSFSIPLVAMTAEAADVVYEVPSVRIRAPLQKGWLLRQRTEHAVIFAYKDPETESDFLAIGSHFEPSWPSSEAEFVADFKKQLEELNHSARRTISARFEAARERGYSCVRAYVITERNSTGSDSALRRPATVYSRTIACRKKAPSRDGLFAHFEYVGREPSQALDSLAESFFEGVRFRKND